VAGPEATVFPLTRQNDISHIVWPPLAQGLLTGKYKPGEQPPADSRAAIIGAYRAEQARANAAASGVDLPQSTLEAID
jgi:aryl-alcohol dehydrogenase-like predicted oxidoreductase